jgi:hypothetical protein
MPDTVWHADREIPIRLYWLVNQTPLADYTIFFHIVERDDSARIAQFDMQPARGYGPMTRWESGELVTSEFYLDLDEDLKPGTYWLLIGAYHPDTVQNLPVSNAPHVLPGDRIVLAEIEIRHE